LNLWNAISNYPSWLIRKTRSYFLKRKISNKDAQIVLNDHSINVKIVKHRSAKIIVRGKLRFDRSPVDTPAYIYLGENATLQIDGDLFINNGVQILIGRNGFLKIGGRETESEPGITFGSKIWVFKKVEIGKDFLCSFNVFITDCDWHCIEYPDAPPSFQSDTIIGDHVWVCHESSILKGTIIGHGSVVGSRSVLSQKIYPENSLIVGMPAKVVKSNCSWKVDLPRT